MLDRARRSVKAKLGDGVEMRRSTDGADAGEGCTRRGGGGLLDAALEEDAADTEVALVQRAPLSKPEHVLLEAVELCVVMRQAFALALMAFIVFMASFLSSSAVIFLVTLGVGAALLLACTPGINVGIMLAVPEANRAFAIAINNFLMHAFGDVPSPIIVGYLKDTWAPGCSGDDDSVATSEDCRDDKAGLRLTVFFVFAWLVWSVLFFGAAWAAAQAGRRRAVLQHRALRGSGGPAGAGGTFWPLTSEDDSDSPWSGAVDGGELDTSAAAGRSGSSTPSGRAAGAGASDVAESPDSVRAKLLTTL
mmetsp:Transcript_7142/g.24037  ORF Transcript_7142/g.24037 Transcript_7142/m.24037 type:complete len:306 (-) Transcript_7142:43-960(-)